MSKTFSAKPADVVRAWYVLDASQATLGRISTTASSLLIGKGKPEFTPHVDGGDFVIVINAGKLKVSGNKQETKVYYRHTGFPGGIKQRTLGEVMEIDPTFAIKNAVRGMLPPNKLRPARLARLKVYEGEDHNHHSQKPKIYGPNLKGTK
jgi:large subunit ribosomal protein L13